MKTRITRKEVKATHSNVLGIGYCNLQNLLRVFEPYAYTTRAEGWAADVYNFGDTAIVTGYDPTGKSVKYDLCRKYDEAAAELLRDTYIITDEVRENMRELVNAFITEATQKSHELTQKESGLVWSYNHASVSDIYDAYEKPSRAKVSAFKECEADKETHNGYGERITGASCHFFSYAFKYKAEDGEHLRYHTHANVYDFVINAADTLASALVKINARKDGETVTA